MRLRDAFSSPSLSDIIYSVRDKGVDPVKKNNEAKDSKPNQGPRARKHKPIDRSQQGAALSGSPNIPLDSPSIPLVESPLTVHPAPTAQKDKQTMKLTLKGLNRKQTTALYSGTPGTVRIGLAAFPNKTAPAEIEVAGGVFAVKAPKAAKVKLSKEERAALPKPTTAEKIAKMEARLVAAKKKLEDKSSEL